MCNRKYAAVEQNKVGRNESEGLVRQDESTNNVKNGVKPSQKGISMISINGEGLMFV